MGYDHNMTQVLDARPAPGLGFVSAELLVGDCRQRFVPHVPCTGSVATAYACYGRAAADAGGWPRSKGDGMHNAVHVQVF